MANNPASDKKNKLRAINGRKLIELCNKMTRWTEINFLLTTDCDVNCTNLDGRSPLHYAAEKGCCDLIAKLIELGADLHIREFEHGLTPLHLAVCCARGKTSTIKLLVEAGADVNALAHQDVTPLHLAVKSGSTNVVKYLLMKGGIASLRESSFNFTPLHIAAFNNRDEMVEVLLKITQIDTNPASVDGITPLHLASMSGDNNIVRRLIERGANVHCRLRYSQITPLHLASMNGSIESIPELMEFFHKMVDSIGIFKKGFAWKRRDDERENYDSVVRILIKNGSDLQAKDAEGRTPLHFAARHQSIVLKTLLKYGADVIALDNDDRLPFHEIVRHGCGLDWMLRYGADINDIDESCMEQIQCIFKRCRFMEQLREHFVKLKAADLPLDELYEPYANENHPKGFMNECLKEVLKMKFNEIADGITYYDLLHRSVSPQTTYDLPYNIESKFPKYHGIIRACCYAPLKRRPLLDSARLAWYHITNVNLPDICVELILSYFSNIELKVIVRGARKMPPLTNKLS